MSNLFKYRPNLPNGTFRSIKIVEINQLDGTFGVTFCPKEYDDFELLLNDNRQHLKRLANPVPNLACIVECFDGRLFRAVIVKHVEPEYSNSPEQYQVYSVDRGNVFTVPETDIYELSNSLSEQSSFIYKCQLDDVDFSIDANLFFAYFQELSNIPSTILAILVNSSDSNHLHFVKLYEYSSKHFAIFNDYINKKVFKNRKKPTLADSRVDNSDKLLFDHLICDKFTPLKTSIDIQPINMRKKRNLNNFDTALELCKEISNQLANECNDFMNDDAVQLIEVDVGMLISSTEFYFVPKFESTRALYRSIFSGLGMLDTTITEIKKNCLYAYFNRHRSEWRRGTVTDWTDSSHFISYLIIDYDTMSRYNLKCRLTDQSKFFKEIIYDNLKINPQAIHCFIPNLKFKTENMKNNFEEFVAFSKEFGNKIFILPFKTKNSDAFHINIYSRQLVSTGLFEEKKYCFQSYAKYLLQKYSDQVLFVSEECDILVSSFNHIFRNSNANFLSNSTFDYSRNVENLRYFRPKYPNISKFKAKVTDCEIIDDFIVIRFSCIRHNKLLNIVNKKIEELISQNINLKRLDQKIIQYDPCLVRDNGEWFRGELIGIVKDADSTLFKVNVRLVDTGHSGLFFIEDIFQHFVEPQIPCLSYYGFIDDGPEVTNVSLDHWSNDKKDDDQVDFVQFNPEDDNPFDHNEEDDEDDGFIDIDQILDFHWLNFPKIPMILKNCTK